MSLKIRRGTNAERLTITPAEGELIYTTDTKDLYVGDGLTVGGKLVTGSGGGGSGGTGYTGSKGDQGEQGLTGSGGTGYTGSKGTDGTIGYWGSVGYTGSKGTNGTDGAIGYWGSRGFTGYTGSIGEGYTGSKGDSIDPSVPAGYTGTFSGSLYDSTGDYLIIDSASKEAIVDAININFENFSTFPIKINGISPKNVNQNPPALVFNTCNGTLAEKTDTVNNDVLGSILWAGCNNEAPMFSSSIFCAVNDTNFNSGSTELLSDLYMGNFSNIVTQNGNYLRIRSNGTIDAKIVKVGAVGTTSLPSGAEAESGMIVFDSTTNQFKGWNGTTWVVLG